MSFYEIVIGFLILYFVNDVIHAVKKACR